MNRITTLVAGLLVAGGAATFALTASAHEGEHAEGTEGETATVVGELVDTACFVSSDGGAKGKAHADCARQCLESGIPAAVLPEGKGADSMLFLLTNPKVLAQYAAKTIKVEGVKHADKRSMDVKHLYVKQDDGSFKEVKLEDYHHKMAGGEDAVKKDAPKDAHDHAGHAGHAH